MLMQDKLKGFNFAQDMFNLKMSKNENFNCI